MATLNQAKIIKALEKIVTATNDDFIFSFLSAYGTPKATIRLLQMGDPQRNVAKIDGDIALSRQIFFTLLQMVPLLNRLLRIYLPFL